MTDRSGAKDLAGYSVLVAFANDDERDVLRNLLKRVEERDVALEVRDEIDRFRAANNI
ncbi:MAG: hypothetical protein RIK85_06895 [Marinobacter sp.]